MPGDRLGRRLVPRWLDTNTIARLTAAQSALAAESVGMSSVAALRGLCRGPGLNG